MADDDEDSVNSSNSSSSSGSDDEFLTAGGADREALVRKKLLENFYGKSAVAASLEAEDELGSSSRRSSSGAARRATSGNNKEIVGTDDLDSPNFDAYQHTINHIQTNTTHELLETEEKLALQVRTLDSTMQTLVYENYSRFIDATDAIRSIGVNVQANETGLKQLTTSMATVNEQSRVIEDALGTLRDQVAEKIRVQRLLKRLDTLLKLPATLQEQIDAGKYKTATKSYLSAASILAKHSEGFESLKSIETECNAILVHLKKDLIRKIMYWSGRETSFDTYSSDDDDNDNNEKVESSSYNNNNNNEQDHNNAPDPPHSMNEVFECTGTLYILLQQDDVTDIQFSIEDLCSMASAAAIRLLDRLLDSHLIDVQERRFNSLDVMMENTTVRDGTALIPRTVLDAILEGAILYHTSFDYGNDQDNKTTESANYYLLEFVSDGYSSFLSHIRSVLLEESAQAGRDDSDEGQGNSEETHQEISAGLKLLVQYVQDLVAGLQDAGIHAEFANKLLDRAVELTESMVRRRVDQKFNDLRLSVVKDCLVPFAKRAVNERGDLTADDGKSALSQIVQIASSTLSDCLQLVDDVIRSIFAESSGSADDMSELKDAVHSSTYRFASWLANAFEILAGGESADPKYLVEAPAIEAEGGEYDEENMDDFDEKGDNGALAEDLGDSAERELIDLMNEATETLLQGGDTLPSDFILAIAELCRLSEASVPENLEQSFTAHIGSGKKKSRGIFPTGETESDKKAQIEDDEISKRFKLASSRVLVLFAINSGMEAANVLCKDLADEAIKSEEDVAKHPSSSALAVLAMAKTTALECASVFGGPKRGGPLPKWDDDAISSSLSPTALMSRKTGLQLDVERMFKENVVIYPHPSSLVEASTNSVLFLFFKIVFRSWFETSRLNMYSSGGFHQAQIDIIFLKHVMPHYVSESYTESGTNACTALISLLNDVEDVIAEQCTDENCAMDNIMKEEANRIVGSFISSIEDSSLADRFIIEEDK